MAHSGKLLQVDIVVIVADDDKMRAVGRISRDILEDIAKAPTIRTGLVITSGNDNLIERDDLVGHTLK